MLVSGGVDVEEGGVWRGGKVFYLVIVWWLMLVGGYCLGVGGEFVVVVVGWVFWCVWCFYLWVDVDVVVEIVVWDW